MDDDISNTIQRYQSIVLLDLLIEFREEFVRRILSRWLRASCLPLSYRRVLYEANIEEYFGRENLASELKIGFEEWRKGLIDEAEPPDETFGKFADQLQTTMNDLVADFQKFLHLVPAGGYLSKAEASHAESKENIDRLREVQFTVVESDRAEARRVGLAVDAFVKSSGFRKYLHPSRSADGTESYGLLAMFNIVLLTVDYTHPVRIESGDGVPRSSGGHFRFVLPPDELLFRTGSDNDDRYRFQTFFPLVREEEEVKRLERAISESVKLCGTEVDQKEIRDPIEVVPAIFRGTNTFVYDTRYARALFKGLTDNPDSFPNEVWTLNRNVNFIQLLPKPELPIFGYFQMQSPLPGLVNALFPTGECDDSWDRVSLKISGDPVKESIALIEMPRSDNKWRDYIKTRHEACEFILEGIYWIQHSVTPWSLRFHSQMVYLNEQRDALWRAIEPRINQRHQQQLELLRRPLENLSGALRDMQRDTQELRAVLYDPAKALFESAPRIKELFEEGGVVPVGRMMRLQIAHEPDKYSGLFSYYDLPPDSSNCRSAQTGVMIMLVAICRVFGVDDELSDARNFEDMKILAHRALLPTIEPGAFPELWQDIYWLFNVGKETGEDFIDSPTKIISLGDSEGGLERMRRFLEHVKVTLFSPFKIDASSWNLLALQLAVKPYQADRNRVFISRVLGAWSQFGAFSGLSPATYSSIIDFVMGVCLSKNSRKIELLEVEGDVYDSSDMVIRLKFTEPFKGVGSSLMKSVQNLRGLIKPLLSGLRDWRLIGANVGNWQGPFIDLSNRLIGVAKRGTSSAEWVSDIGAASDKFVIFLKRGDGAREFSISIDDDPNGILELNWRKLV